MQYITIFHANLNYAYLTEDRYEFVIRRTYEMTLDTMQAEFPDVPFVFEASGYTLEHMAQKTPDVLEKLKAAIARGQCEFMGSPYAHPMLPNFPKDDGLWSIQFSNEVYERLLGFRPKSFWNPECGWRSYVPTQVVEAGYSNMIGDFEAYSRSCGPTASPCDPKSMPRNIARNRLSITSVSSTICPVRKKPCISPLTRFTVSLPADQLRIFLRTDRLAQFGVRYFMGMEGYTLEKYLDLVRKYSEQPAGEPEGAVIIFADDAEYIGTNGWFRLKFQNQPDNVFEATPESRQKLIDLISAVRRLGRFVTFDQACRTLPPLPEEITFDDNSAWHGARSSTWANTPMARLLRPWQELVRARINSVPLDDETKKMAWFHLTNSYNSDGQWPPTLPEAPHIVHPYNYAYCFENLLRAEMLVGGVPRDQLNTNPAETLKEILGPQQQLILAKAEAWLATGSADEKAKAARARMLIQRSQAVDSLGLLPVLYPSDYSLRAEALVEARRLVGGVQIEKTA